jgi:two-component system, chemotaxis family, response regulator Rcp1
MNEITPRAVEILLVEDNPGDVRLTMEMLKEAKIRNTVRVAMDGFEAMQMLRKQGKHANAPTPDLIFLDLKLPRMNGHEVLAQVKSDPALRKIPVVVLTTSSSEEDVLRAYDHHANCYVTKPVGLDQFAKIVRTIDDFWLSVVVLPPNRK